MAEKNKSNELKLTRVYDAPVKAVWDAWTDPEQAAKWWGPRGFTITTHSKDLRPGGIWHYTMHGPDGTDYPNKTKYLEIEKYSRLVYDHGGYDDRPPLFRVTVLFTESRGRTRMEMTMSLPTPEALEETRNVIKKHGGNSTWDRLAEYLEKSASGKETFVINRSFDVPIETMFEMWANPKHLSQWLAPVGYTMSTIRSDVKPGGGTFYSMTTDKNLKFHGRIEYLEIARPHRIIYTQQFCDENEKVVRHYLSPTWPESMLTTVTFAEEAPDRTRVTVTWEPCGKVSGEELATFTQAKSGMTQGWTGSFDKLEAYAPLVRPSQPSR